MLSKVHAFIVALLCSFAALGHAPAWFHVYKCAEFSVEQRDHNLETVVISQYNCCANRHGESTCGEEGQDRDSSDDAPYNDNSCAVCQSLAGPVGFVWTPVSTCVRARTIDRTAVVSARIAHQQWADAAHPRGPPLSFSTASSKF